MSNYYSISEETLKALDEFMYRVAAWLNTDAKYAHPNSGIVAAKTHLYNVRTLLLRDLKDDISRKVSAEQTVVGQGDTSGTVSPSHEEKRGEVESI